ncbi:sporulation protein, partial [Streptomyces sp. NPDC059567]|uniref:sporulation protein n=1 Tax=Streptomyces sp. NPDC059567 TaxID=3346867 RepID=UPI00368693C7
MVFKRLLGKGGIPLEIDTLVQSEPALPGGLLTGEVVLRAPERRVELKGISLRLVTDAPGAPHGDGDGASGATVGNPRVCGDINRVKGGGRRVPHPPR